MFFNNFNFFLSHFYRDAKGKIRVFILGWLCNMCSMEIEESSEELLTLQSKLIEISIFNCHIDEYCFSEFFQLINLELFAHWAFFIIFKSHNIEKSNTPVEIIDAEPKVLKNFSSFIYQGKVECDSFKDWIELLAGAKNTLYQVWWTFARKKYAMISL